MRVLGASLLPSCVSHNSLGPRRRIGRASSNSRLRVPGRQSSSFKTKAWRLSWGGNQRMKLAQPRPSSMGRQKHSSRGKSSGAPPSTTDTVATNKNRSGRREVERSHPRERGGCEGGGGEEEGSVRSWRFGLSLAGPDAISEMGARGACGCCLPWKRKPRAGRHGAGARINDDNDRGVKVFSQSQGPLWQSAAEREGLVRAL